MYSYLSGASSRNQDLEQSFKVHFKKFQELTGLSGCESPRRPDSEVFCLACHRGGGGGGGAVGLSHCTRRLHRLQGRYTKPSTRV